MSSQNTPPATAQQRGAPTPDQKTEAAVEHTFPASDPVGNMGTGGARARP